jgi:uncharacterized protein YaiI (UPF0178 family)
MQIWVDADACPKVIKEILYRAAERVQVPLILVSNQYQSTPPSRFIRSVRVDSGFDVADNYIEEHLNVGDLVITADIPLAANVVAAKAYVINPRGERYTENNIRERLNMRDFMDQIRSSGVHTGGPPPMTQADRQQFANALDTLLRQIK